MWQPYIDVIKNKAPKALLVFDKFHIVQHLTKAVDQVRRDEIQYKGKAHKALMAKIRYIWLKNPWNLTESQKIRLSALEKLNLKINRAYLLKEAFRRFWDYRNPVLAKDYIGKGFWWATRSRREPMRTLPGCYAAERMTCSTTLMRLSIKALWKASPTRQKSSSIRPTVSKQRQTISEIFIPAWLICHYQKPCTHLRDESRDFDLGS